MTLVSYSRAGKSPGRYSGKVLLFMLLGLFLIGTDLYAQMYEATLSQRRRGDQIHVEVWVKSLSASAPALGDASLVMQYNQTYLAPAAVQTPSSTDSISYDVDIANPVISITSGFNGANGYNGVTTASYGAGLYAVEVQLTSLGSGGLQPGTDGRGSYLGKVIFDIQNSPATSVNTDIAWSTAVVAPGNIEIFDVNGNNMRTLTTFTNPSAMTIVGITLLNPNGPSEVVDRDKSYLSILGTDPDKGYPIYFERSGLDPINNNVHSTSATAYIIEYSLNGGSSWTELGRVAETTTQTSSIASLSAIVSGQLSTTATSHVITLQNGLPITSASFGYREPMRIVWTTNASFFGRSENGRMRITQLTTPVTANISSRTKQTPTDMSDANFVIGRLFFAQLNGTDQYLRTAGTYSNATPLTVETWINLNEYKGMGSETGIVASGAGAASQGEEGAWMLYLKDGRYPAFRAREILGRGPGGYIATIVSPDPLPLASDVSPLGSSHAANWIHIAATVDKDTMILYVNGEMVDRKTNDSATDVRMMTTNHPIWIGVNPTTSGAIPADNYLHAGLKGTRVWRAALPQDSIRQRVSGIASVTTTSGTINVLKSLELYYTLEGSLRDAATEQYFQGLAQDAQFYTGGVVSNAMARFRPDLGHIRLTSPVGGEGVTNLLDSTFAIRWVGYGIGTVATLTNLSADVTLQFSIDGGTTWSTAGSVGGDLLGVNLEAGEAIWMPSTSASLRFLPGNAYSHNALVRIIGTSSNDANVSDISESFTVAPYFSMRKTANAIVTIDDGGDNRSFNITGSEAFLESWIRPYRFPTVGEGYFPIVSKIDTTTGDLYYSLRLLPTGQIQFVIRDNAGVLRTATSDADAPLIRPNSLELDSAWTHVGVYVDLGNGGTSNVRFYIDGTAQTDTAITNQLGTGLEISSLNEYPVYIGYEVTTTATRSFIGEYREVRYWSGSPNSSDASGTEPTAMTNFIQGALNVRAEQLVANSSGNLVASISFNGHSFINGGFHRSIRTSSPTIRARFYADSIRYVAAEPYIKIVEPTFRQRIRNSETDTRIRWVGFDYGTVTTGTTTATLTAPSLEYSIRGGGGNIVQPYQYVSSDYWDVGQADATVLTSTASYRFTGTGSILQFGAQLDVSNADPDPNDDGVFAAATGPLSATLTNARLRITATPSPLITTTSSVTAVVGEGPLFTIVPPSNFTVRVVLEGYHDDFTTTATLTDLQTNYAGGGLKIKLFRDNAGTPGELADSAESEYQYADRNFGNRNAGTNQFANVPFIFTNLPDGNYWVVVQHPNHLPVMSRYPAPFRFSGDDEATWDIESGWDFQSWMGAYNNTLVTSASLTSIPSGAWLTQGLFSAYSGVNTPANVTEANVYAEPYSRTGLIFNRGIAGNGAITSGTAVAAMVGGDVTADGQINAADRVQVVLDAGTSLVRSDITGDGTVNAVDREIVFRNVGKVSSIIDVTFPSAANGGSEPPVPMMAGTAAGSRFDNGAATEKPQAFFGAAQPGTTDEPTFEPPVAIPTGAISYTVTAEPKIVGNFIEIPVSIRNNGSTFGMGNATFALSYNTSALRFVSLDNVSDVPYNNNSAKGYAPMFSAPKPNVNQALPNVRSIEIEYSKLSGKTGENVPSTKQSVGTLRFEIKRTDMPLVFNWFRSTVVLATDGTILTGRGTFQPIKPILLYNATVLFPNGGESWRTNKTYTVTWKNNNAPTVRIEFSTDNGATWQSASKNAVQSSLQAFQWQIPTTLNSDQCLIRIVDNETGIELDRSDRTFKISAAFASITRPAAADPIYKSGKSETIAWQSVGYSKVRFEFSADGGSTWTAVSTERNASDGLLYWSVPSVNTKNAMVRMFDTEDGSEIARTGNFKILAGSLSFTTPKTGDQLPSGSSSRVRWNSDNLDAYDLEYSVDGGINWTPVQYNVDAVKRTYDWMVPAVSTKEGMLRALYNGDPELEYDRSPIFEIQGVTGVEEIAEGMTFGSPYPNPFTDRTSVSFSLADAGRVTMAVYNELGEKVIDIANASYFGAGAHTVTISCENLSSGVYYLHFNAGGVQTVRRLLVVR